MTICAYMCILFFCMCLLSQMECLWWHLIECLLSSVFRFLCSVEFRFPLQAFIITEDYLGRNNNLDDNAWFLVSWSPREEKRQLVGRCTTWETWERRRNFTEWRDVRFLTAECCVQVLAFQVRKDWFKENGEDCRTGATWKFVSDTNTSVAKTLSNRSQKSRFNQLLVPHAFGSHRLVPEKAALRTRTKNTCVNNPVYTQTHTHRHTGSKHHKHQISASHDKTNRHVTTIIGTIVI